MKRNKTDSDLVFSEKYLRTKTKPYNQKITEEGLEWLIQFSNNTCFKYCPKTFQEECKHKIKEKEFKSLVRDNPLSSSDDYAKKENLEENSD